MRRGDTIVHLRPREHEDLIRHKEVHVGAPAAEMPLQAGFVEGPAVWFARIVARVVNVTDEPVTGVTILWDVRLAGKPGSLARTRSRIDHSMGPGVVLEVELDPRKHWFWLNGATYSADDTTTIDRWFDVRLCVQYRDKDGFIQEMNRFLSLGD
jgi:hypothetical protein